MKQDAQFTQKLQQWMNTPDSQKDWSGGALMLLQLSGNQIMYRNISHNPKGKADFIKGQLQKYLNFRLKQLTHDQVEEMQQKVEVIVQKVIKPNASLINPSSVGANGISETDSGKSQEFADFKAGKRADHDLLPDEIKALYAENLDIVHRMREVHLKLRTLSLENATCPDSERYPFLKEIIALDKRLHENWDMYDHFVIGTVVDGSPIDTNANKGTDKADAEAGLSPETPADESPESQSQNTDASESDGATGTQSEPVVQTETVAEGVTVEKATVPEGSPEVSADEKAVKTKAKAKSTRKSAAKK
jgi:hypothetical protein